MHQNRLSDLMGNCSACGDQPNEAGCSHERRMCTRVAERTAWTAWRLRALGRSERVSLSFPQTKRSAATAPPPNVRATCQKSHRVSHTTDFTPRRIPCCMVACACCVVRVDSPPRRPEAAARSRAERQNPESVNALFHLPVPFRCKGGLAFSGRDTFTIFAFTSNPLVWFRLT